MDGSPVVGEAKTTDALDEPGKDAPAAARLFCVADVVTADELVFATTRPTWHKRSKAAIEAEASKSPTVRTRMLEGVK